MARILIIDDDEAIRRMLRFRLKDRYDIMDTASPEAVLMSAAAQARYCLRRSHDARAHGL